MFYNQRPLAIQKRNMGDEALIRHDYDVALALYNESLNLHPMADTFKQRAIVYIYLELHTRAIEDCKYVLKSEDFNANPWFSRSTMIFYPILIIIIILIIIVIYLQTR